MLQLPDLPETSNQPHIIIYKLMPNAKDCIIHPHRARSSTMPNAKDFIIYPHSPGAALCPMLRTVHYDTGRYTTIKDGSLF